MANDKNKKIEVVQGKGKLNISPVKTHLEVEKPKKKADKNSIIIPKVKSKKQ